MTYPIEISPAAAKALSKLAKANRLRVAGAIEDDRLLVLVLRVAHRRDVYDR